MSFTDTTEDAILDLILGAAGANFPATVYVAASNTIPSDEAGTNFTEPVGNGYTRVAVTNNGTEWPAAVSGLKSNANDVVFPQATGAWGTIEYFGLYDALTVGNLLLQMPLTSPSAIILDDIALRLG